MLAMAFVLGCSSSGPVDEAPPCYGIRDAKARACASDWSGIDQVQATAGVDGTSTTSRECSCPSQTFCHPFDGIIACVLEASP